MDDKRSITALNSSNINGRVNEIY